MSTKLLRTARPIVLVVALIVLALAAGSVSPASAGKDSCRNVNGKVEIHQDSTTGVTNGKVTGGLKGDVSFLSATGPDFSLPDGTAPAETPDTAIFVFSRARLQFDLHDGTLFATAFMVYTPTKEFSEVITVTGGAGKYAGVTGTMTATGAVDPKDSDTGLGDYSGQICFP